MELLDSYKLLLFIQYCMKRYSVLPITLYRFQAKETTILRQQSYQLQLNRMAFDFKLGQNKLYNPIQGDKFIRPNGLSLRPLSLNLAQLIQSLPTEYIYELPQGLTIPSNMIMIHERSDHYSLQTTQPVKPSQFCIRAMQLFKQQKRLKVTEIKERLKKLLQS